MANATTASFDLYLGGGTGTLEINVETSGPSKILFDSAQKVSEVKVVCPLDPSTPFVILLGESFLFISSLFQKMVGEKFPMDGSSFGICIVSHISLLSLVEEAADCSSRLPLNAPDATGHFLFLPPKLISRVKSFTKFIPHL